MVLARSADSTFKPTCAPESPSLIHDIQSAYDGDAKSLVIRLQKGPVYKLKGTLTTSTLFELTPMGCCNGSPQLWRSE
jgi:hypothetical protein